MKARSSWQHQVEMKIAPRSASERLRRIGSWCVDWQIGFRVLDPKAPGNMLRIAFDNAGFARAFQSHFGGVIVPLDEVGRAMTSDDHDDDDYDRLAPEFPG